MDGDLGVSEDGMERIRDNLFDEGPDLFDLENDHTPLSHGVPFNDYPDSVSFSIGQIEQLLMRESGDDNEDAVGEDAYRDFSTDFLSDILLDSPIESDRPAIVDDVSDKNSNVSDKEEEVHAIQQDKNEKNNGDVNNDVNDPISKKLKRQLRNRDAAVRSRERKKMYVRDLEMKSRYYEAECKRLGILLQCCYAENQALRLSLHNSKAIDASVTKQESAVLLLESLLLGSLLWLLGIICLFDLPRQLLSTLEAVPVQNDMGNRSLAPRKPENETLGRLIFWFCMMMGKRCKASRSRIKSGSSVLGALVCC